MTYLFTGVETYTWGWSDFDRLITFCKAHKIDGVELKVYEITQGEWYQSLGGASKVVMYLINKDVSVLPYGYFYGATSQEIDYSKQALKRWGRFAMNCEDAWQNDTSRANAFANALDKHTGTLYLSTFADPLTTGWIQNIPILDRIVDVWQPEEYGDNLIDLRLQEFPPVRGRVIPTYSLNPPVTVNRMLIDREVSIWEYADALTYPSLLDAMIAHEQTVIGVSPMLWFQYPIGVPFGNPNFDVGLGGSHDMTILAPPNMPVTAVRNGIVSSITSPSWGKQVGVQLDSTINGNGYMSYLHLSAVNPSLMAGFRVSIGDIIGWVGGANDPAQYLGTSNPTGNNFLNTPDMSSQVQVGLALMRGPEYGVGNGWVQFPPIDMSLDPLSLVTGINAMRAAFENEWTCIVPTSLLNSGIANAAWNDYQKGKFKGAALTPELTKGVNGRIWTDWAGSPISIVETSNGRYEYNIASKRIRFVAFRT